MTQSFETLHQLPRESIGVQFIEVIRTHVFVVGLTLKQMIGGLQQRMTHGHNCALLASSTCQTTETGRQVRVLRMACRPGRLAQRASQPTVPLASLALLAFAGRLV